MPGSGEPRRESSPWWRVRRRVRLQAGDGARIAKRGSAREANTRSANGAGVPTTALLLLVLAALMPVPVAAERPTFRELEESLTCQCGCGLTVASCNHLQCPSAIPLRQEIRSQMAGGFNKDEILAYFADKYGEKILSAPTATGFNLTAWVIPFAALAAGGVLVGVTLVRWRKARRRVPAEALPPQPGDQAGPSPYDKILERELKQFDG